MIRNTSILDILTKASLALKREGIGYVLRNGIKFILNLPKNQLWYWYYKTFRSAEAFKFRGKRYYYYYHPYGTTWKNERCVEIPIVWDIVKKNEKNRILEVGNVLSHRFPVNHDILDKYEIKAGVINEDVVNFKSLKKYDLIISISTIEHVGWDETPKDDTKLLRAVENLKRLLAPNGQIVLTVPFGYNPELDGLIKSGSLRFDEQFYLKRISKNKWHEASWEVVKDSEYNSYVPSANGIMIAVIGKSL